MPEKTLSLSRWGIVADDMSSNGIMFCCTGTWLFTPMALSAAKDPGLLANTLSLLMVASMSWRATFRRGATAAFLSARVFRIEHSDDTEAPIVRMNRDLAISFGLIKRPSN